MQVIKEMVDATVVTFGGNFKLVNKALTKIEETTKRMTGLLEDNRSQLHQLRNNEAAWVTVMQEHRDRLDDIDAILTRVTNSVMKLGNLVHKLDSKMSANRPATPQDDQPCPVEHPPAPSRMFPAWTSANKGTRPSLVESDPNHAPVPPAGPAPNHFSNVRLGPPVMRASLYPSGNRLAPDDI